MGRGSGRGFSPQQFGLLKNVRAIIKIRADAVCCIHVNTYGTIKSISQSLSVICSQ